MPYKDPQRQREYKKIWRGRQKEWHTASQKVYLLRHEIKQLQAIDPNSTKLPALVERLEEAFKIKEEISKIEENKREIQKNIRKELKRTDKIAKAEAKAYSIYTAYDDAVQAKQALSEERDKLQEEFDKLHARNNYNQDNADCTESQLPDVDIKNRSVAGVKKAKIRQRNLTYIWDYKSKNPCKNCGATHPAVLCFHHRDSSQKEDNIACLLGKSLDRIKNEIAKCDVLCHNCHSLVHWKDRYKLSTKRSRFS